MSIANDYIYIDSPNDIDTAIELMVDYAKNPPKNEYFYWGGIIMPLTEKQQFTSYIHWFHPEYTEKVTITEAFCGVTMSYNHETKHYEITCSALNEKEGYYTTKESSFGEGVFIAATDSIKVLRQALIRFFSLKDFTTQQPDPLTRTVIPIEPK